MQTKKNHVEITGKDSFFYVFDHDDNIVIELDTNKKIKNANIAAQTFLGADMQALLNKEILSHCAEKQLPFPNFMRKNIIKKELFEEVDSNNTTDSKPLHYISWRVVPLYFEGKLTGHLLFGKDITSIKLNERSLKNVETRLESIINIIPGYHWWKDLNGKYLGCNEAVAKLLGLNSANDVIGKTDYELAWSKNADLMTENDRKVIDSGEALWGEEIITTTNDTPLIFFIVKIPLRNDLSEIIGTIGSSIDITNRKKMEEELRLAKIKSEAASHAKTEFIANMSHDIRTPLSGVIGMSEILEHSLNNDTQKEQAHMLHESGEQLLRMLNGILDDIRAEHLSDGDIQEHAFDLYACIQELVQLELPTTTMKNLKLAIAINEDVPQYIVSDKKKIHRTLLNLLGNAIKFTQSGKITIEIKCLNRNTNKVHLQFGVADTGIGIPKELQEKVFDRFFRVTSSYKGHYAGHGLGLHIAQSYVSLLGGHITLTSEEGVGSTFYFDLSCDIGMKPSPTPEITAHSTRQSSTPASPPSHKIPHILLVEDDAIALRVMETIVKKAGYTTSSAKDGEQALELVKSTDFNLIITDIGLPGISGYEFTQQVRKWENMHGKSSLPIIGLTGHARDTAKEECMACGMNEVYTKPISQSILQEMVSFIVAPDERKCK